MLNKWKRKNYQNQNCYQKYIARYQNSADMEGMGRKRNSGNIYICIIGDQQNISPLN